MTMYDRLFSDFDHNDRIWVYAFNRSLTAREADIVNHELTQFVNNWASHGNKVLGVFQILSNRFVVLCASKKSEVSGCSIDSSINLFRKLKNDHNLDALDQNLIHYRENGKIFSHPRADFFIRSERNITRDTIIFDISLQTLGELRAGNFEIPAEKSWLAHKISA